MLKNCLIIACLFVCMSSYAQTLAQVTFTRDADFAWFTLITNQNILIRISINGKILEAGTEQAAINNRNYIARNLLPYQGSVTYFQSEADTAIKGKIKNIGTCYFTYYPSSDYPERAGKIKSAGNLFFDYYRKYEDTLVSGKIKSIGSNVIAWYNSFDNDALRGKLKSVGVTDIQYYSSFDDPYLKGKLKSIGNYRFEWTRTFSGKDFFVGLKNPFQRMAINGIVYIPQ